MKGLPRIYTRQYLLKLRPTRRLARLPALCVPAGGVVVLGLRPPLGGSATIYRASGRVLPLRVASAVPDIAVLTIVVLRDSAHSD